MKTFIELHDYYLNDIPGCSFKMAADAARIASQAFFERTRAWRVDLDPVATIAGVSEYVLPLSLDVELVRVESAKLGGRPIDVVLPGDVAPGRTCLAVHGLRAFTVHPAPPAGQAVVVKASLEPSNTATGLDDTMFAKYARIIGIGAKAHLLAMSNQPFSDIGAASLLRAQFDAEIDKVMADIGRNYSSAPRRVAAHFC